MQSPSRLNWQLCLKSLYGLLITKTEAILQIFTGLQVFLWLDNLVDLKGNGEQLLWIGEQLFWIKNHTKYQSGSYNRSFDLSNSNSCLSAWNKSLPGVQVKISRFILRRIIFKWQERGLKWMKALFRNTLNMLNFLFYLWCMLKHRIQLEFMKICLYIHLSSFIFTTH